VVLRQLPQLRIERLIAGAFFDSDPTRQSPNPNKVWDTNLRLTLQASQRNKVGLFYDKQGRSQDHRYTTALQSLKLVAARITPQCTLGNHAGHPLYRARCSWKLQGRTTTKVRISITARSGSRHIPTHRNHDREVTVADSVGPSRTNHKYWNLLANWSYVTGSHAFKTGVSDYFGTSFARNRSSCRRSGSTTARLSR
jgi:hypothetical protein